MFEVPEHTKLRRLRLIKVSIGTDGHRPGTGRESSRTELSSRDETPPASIHIAADVLGPRNLDMHGEIYRFSLEATLPFFCPIVG